MTRNTSLVAGAALILIGGLSLAYDLLAARFALPVPAPWRLWPLVITAVGLLFLVPPLLSPRQRDLGWLFIPGLPILIAGGLGTLTLFLPGGLVWSRLWPQILLAIALGLGLAAFYVRNVWLIIPAAMFGALGAALQLSALTGWWSAWSVLWAVLPLSIGLSLVAIGQLRGSGALRFAGLLLSGVTGLGAMGLAALLGSQWGVVNAAGALLLIGAGVALTGLSYKRRLPPAEQAS